MGRIGPRSPDVTETSMETTTDVRIQVEPLTCAIGAELKGVNLGDAARDDALFERIKALLFKHKVL